MSHVSGFVSILGRPNAGKSTLMNALVGSKVAIVANKPQTTRTTIQGVWTQPDSQVVFLDTPGILKAETVFHRRMMQALHEALDSRDLFLFVVDATRPHSPEDEDALSLLSRSETPVILLLNKVDAVADKATLLPRIEALTKVREFEEVIPISALTGEGLDTLRKAILARMPEGPAYFPEDYLTDQPERFIVAETIREKILALTRQEVPHSVAVLVENWEEKGRLTHVDAAIHVERQGQKVIILGAGGAMLKQIGTQARQELEQLLDRRFYLALHVKVTPRWRENPAFLKELDWRAMLGAESAKDE